MSKIHVTVWNEYRHERVEKTAKELYPDGLHKTIAAFLAEDADLEIRTAVLDEPDCGLQDEVLNNTDVLIWWGHMSHNDVPDELAEKVRLRVYNGMGFIALHSGHHSKPFKKTIGTTGNLSWGREQKEIIWNMMPAHPIAAGLPDHFCLDSEELYAEPFYIPQPDALVFGGWFEDGFLFRSGACFLRGTGKVFYFQPGHETCKSFYNPYVQKIIRNAVHWAAPALVGFEVPQNCPHILNAVTDEFQS